MSDVVRALMGWYLLFTGIHAGYAWPTKTSHEDSPLERRMHETGSGPIWSWFLYRWIQAEPSAPKGKGTVRGRRTAPRAVIAYPRSRYMALAAIPQLDRNQKDPTPC